jgi:hypothetical protein
MSPPPEVKEHDELYPRKGETDAEVAQRIADIITQDLLRHVEEDYQRAIEAERKKWEAIHAKKDEEYKLREFGQMQIPIFSDPEPIKAKVESNIDKVKNYASKLQIRIFNCPPFFSIWATPFGQTTYTLKAGWWIFSFPIWSYTFKKD